MGKERIRKNKYIAAGIALMFSTMIFAGQNQTLAVQAEEGYYDEFGTWISEDEMIEPEIGGEFAMENEAEGTQAVADSGNSDMAESVIIESQAASLTGTYTLEEGWSVDDAASTQDVTVYRQDSHAGETNTSTITCSYMDTNYSVMEYEQLRDMLTNNLLYSNVNAQISTSAVYTQAKDYLYILLVDDSAQEYRDLYYYVVGDYRCFCLTVKEYRVEAEQAAALQVKTPQEVGQKAAEGFVWNVN